MKLAIVVVEDEPEVRDAVLGDLAPFADTVRIEPAEDVDDALEVVDEIDGDGDVVARRIRRTRSGPSTRPGWTTTSPSPGGPPGSRRWSAPS